MNAQKVHTIPLHVAEPSGVHRSDYPVTAGVPIPRGALTSTEQMVLTDASGGEMPLQAKGVAIWPDRSVKWALLDFQVDLEANEEKVYELRFGEGVSRSGFESPLDVRDRGKRIEVTTGPLKFTVDRTRFRLLDAAWLDLDGDGAFDVSEQIVSEEGEVFVELEGTTGKRMGRYRASLDRRCSVTVEEAGPLRAVLKAEGWHTAEDGRSAVPFSVRIVAYANCSFLTVYHTFVMSESPAEVLFRSIGLSLPVSLNEARCAVAGDEVVVDTLDGGERRTLFQDAPDHYALSGGGGDGEGTCSGGWIDLNDGAKGVTLFVRDIEKLFPKALEAEEGRLTAYLWPSHGDALDLRLQLTHPSEAFEAFKREHPKLFRMSEHGGIAPEEARKTLTDASGRTAMGVARTHEMAVYFHGGDHVAGASAEMARTFNKPLTAFVTPEWYIDTNVLGKFHPYDPERFPRIENWFDKLFAWMFKHQHEWSRWYGMIDYGDVQSRRDMLPGEWSRFCCRWGWLNSEVDMYLTAFLQYMRTGDRKYFDFGEAYARHHMDVDTTHYHEDPRFVGMGGRHDIDHWGGGAGSSHQWVNGTLLYYYLTGYGRAFDVAVMVGDYFLDDPIRMSVEDGNASREAVNGWSGAARLWEATGEEKYKTAADEAARSYLEKQLPNGLWHKLMIGYMAPAVVTWYLISDSKDCEEIMRRFNNYSFSVLQNGLGNPAPFYAYQYRLTGDIKYLISGYRETVARISDYADEIDPDTFLHSRIDVVGGLPYFMAALCDSGADLTGYLPKTARRRGGKRAGPADEIFLGEHRAEASGEAHSVQPLDGCAFVPLDLRGAANRDPYREPFHLSDVPPPNPTALKALEQLRPLKEGEIGFQFSHPINPVRPGYLLVTTNSVYPARSGDPEPGDNFVGYPFGATVELGGVPFDLIDPARNGGNAVVVLDGGESASVPVGGQVRRVHFLGQVYRRSSHRDVEMFADVEVARYVVHYADGSSDVFPLMNNRHMEDFKSPAYARCVHLVRDLEGRWAGGHLNVFSIEPKPKAIERIEFADSGAGYNPALLGVTLEREGEEKAASALRRFCFGAEGREGCLSVAEDTRYTSEAGYGWTEAGGVVDMADRALLKGESEFRVDLPDGTYEIALALQSESSGGASIDLDVAGERRLDNVEISVEPADRFKFLAAAEGGRLPIGIRVNGMLGDFEEVALRELNVVPAPEGVAYERLPDTSRAVRFGWNNIAHLSDSSFYAGIMCTNLSARKVFTAEVADGKYDVEIDLSAWYPGHPVHVNVYVQEELIVESLDIGTATCAHTAKVADGELRIAVETHLEDTHSRAPRWEIHAVRICPAGE